MGADEGAIMSKVPTPRLPAKHVEGLSKLFSTGKERDRQVRSERV